MTDEVSPVGLKMGYSADSLPRTERVSKCILRLPLHNNMSSEDANRVCSLIEMYFDDK